MIDALASAFSSSGVFSSRPSVPYEQKSRPAPPAASSFTQDSSLVQISTQGRNALQASGQPQDSEFREEDKKEKSDIESGELSKEEKEEVKELKDRDREVRQHEQAHLAAAGGYAKGGAHYEYTQGPDGKRYASAGHVNIDTSPVRDNPEATLKKAQVIKRAANAPAEPSGKDRQVASQATKMEIEARKQLMEEQKSEKEVSGEGRSSEVSGYGQKSQQKLGLQLNLTA